jgi:hypothetical protein
VVISKWLRYVLASFHYVVYSIFLFDRLLVCFNYFFITIDMAESTQQVGSYFLLLTFQMRNLFIVLV